MLGIPPICQQTWWLEHLELGFQTFFARLVSILVNYFPELSFHYFCRLRISQVFPNHFEILLWISKNCLGIVSANYQIYVINWAWTNCLALQSCLTRICIIFCPVIWFVSKLLRAICYYAADSSIWSSQTVAHRLSLPSTMSYWRWWACLRQNVTTLLAHLDLNQTFCDSTDLKVMMLASLTQEIVRYSAGCRPWDHLFL